MKICFKVFLADFGKFREFSIQTKNILNFYFYFSHQSVASEITLFCFVFLKKAKKNLPSYFLFFIIRKIEGATQ